jgi:hypothetical protein|tara:strand:- start:3261 stop:3740 length:480 start_codon:yes stop_codon:yes gene_type:complete
MGTANSTLVTNFEADPMAANDVALLHGSMRVAQGTIVVAAGDSDDNDILMLAPIPSNATVPHIFLGSDTLGGSNTMNIGVYTSAGVVVDEDLFATLVADAGAMTDVRHEAANINTCGQKMWELAGASSDGGGYYYIAATMAAAGGTEGDLSFIIHYVVS